MNPLPARWLGPKAARTLTTAVLLVVCALQAHAWTINIAAASRRVFLHVGNGTADGNNGTVNRVEANVSGANLVASTPVAMTSNSTQSNSLQDGFNTCPNPASQLLVGASYRRSSTADGPASASLRVTSPANLVNAAGDTLPFSDISWTVAAPGSPAPGIIPAGTFNGGTLTLTTIPANRYIENCHSFVYANSALRAAGTYNGQVTYTLSSP